jgi:hypothetical protein
VNQTKKEMHASDLPFVPPHLNKEGSTIVLLKESIGCAVIDFRVQRATTPATIARETIQKPGVLSA